MPSTPDPLPTATPAAPRRYTVAALVVTVLWSSSWVLIRLGLDDGDGLAPLTFAGLRYSAAAVVLWVAYGIVRPVNPAWRPGELPGLVVLGVVTYAVTQGSQFVAIAHQPAATTSLVLSLTPLLVGLVARRTLGEPASPAQLAGAALVAAGAATYFASGLGVTTVGLAAAGLGLAANVAGGLLGRHVNRSAGRPALVVTAVSMSVGAAVLLASGLVVEGVPRLTPRAALIVAWLAIVNTALAFTLWNVALGRLSAVAAAGINNLMLIQIAALGWVFLGEPLGAAGTVGVLLVSAGVYLTQRVSPGSTSRGTSRRRPSRG